MPSTFNSKGVISFLRSSDRVSIYTWIAPVDWMAAATVAQCGINFAFCRISRARPDRLVPNDRAHAFAMNTRRWIVPTFACLIAVVAIVLRLYRLDTIPPGLQHDEVFHGHDAVTVLLGHPAIYFPSNAGNEPLYIYLTAGTIALLGKNPWGIRMAAVLCGLATVLFTGLWIRRAYNMRTALIASALVAVTFWPLFMSRVGLRSAALPRWRRRRHGCSGGRCRE